MTYSELRRDLLAKLGVSRQRLSQRVGKRKAELPMTTELAIYTIAHEEGIDISRYLTAEVTAEVRALVAQLRPIAVPAAEQSKRMGTTRRAPAKAVLVTIAGIKVEQLPGMSRNRAREAKVMSEKVYPMLYVFENSARDVISRILHNAFGDNWWEQVVPKRQRERAAKHQADEVKNPWHGKRGAAPIDYVLLSDLPDIITTAKAWPHFEPLFDRRSWFSELIADLNVSRRVASHMNPLEDDDIKNLEAAFRKWGKLLDARKDLLA